MKKVIKKYGEPTPRYWRKIGDFGLLLLVTIQPMVLSMPINEANRFWIDFFITIFLVGVKFWTNTKSIHTK